MGVSPRGREHPDHWIIRIGARFARSTVLGGPHTAHGSLEGVVPLQGEPGGGGAFVAPKGSAVLTVSTTATDLSRLPRPRSHGLLEALMGTSWERKAV